MGCGPVTAAGVANGQAGQHAQLYVKLFEYATVRGNRGDMRGMVRGRLCKRLVEAVRTKIFAQFIGSSRYWELSGEHSAIFGDVFLNLAKLHRTAVKEKTVMRS